MSEEALKLAEQYGGVWVEHPDVLVDDWEHEVSWGGTRSSYWDFVLSRLEKSAA